MMMRVEDEQDAQFRETVAGLHRGDFSRLAPLFGEGRPSDDAACAILTWHANGAFAQEPVALAEALTCACFSGRTALASYLLSHGVGITAGSLTGMNGVHWAANRGQVSTVRMLIERAAPLEVENAYGGTVLGCAVWSAVHEPRAGQLECIEALLEAGARVDAAEYPSGREVVDVLLRRFGAGV